MKTKTNLETEADINVDAMDNDFRQYNNVSSVVGEINIEEHLKYPFVDALKTNVDDIDLPLDTQVDMCIYRINKSHDSLPFLEFLLYLENDSKNKTLIFPYILSRHTRTGLVEQCSPALKALFCSDGNDLEREVKYEGYVYDKRDKKCTLFFNKFYKDENKSISIPFVDKTNRWFWAMSSEIFNEHAMMQYPISESVVGLFNRYPSIMHLKLKNQFIQSPCALYAGKHFNYISYMAAFGVKKASTRAHFGPYYYFVSFIGAMRYACYSMGFEPHVLEDGTTLTVNKHGKHTRGGLVRFAVFLGRCRAFFMNGDEDRSELSMFWANKDPFVKAKLALRDINGDWTRSFNSAYVGKYDLKIGEKTKTRIPTWTIKDYDNQIPLSCHEVDIKSVPDEYDSEYTNYKMI